MSARPEADEANYLERRTVRTVDARPMRTSRLFDARKSPLKGARPRDGNGRLSLSRSTVFLDT